jgi:hypothetical protein
LENVANARLCNVQVFDQLGPAVRVNNARQVALDRVTSSTLEPGTPLVSLTNVTD